MFLLARRSGAGLSRQAGRSCSRRSSCRLCVRPFCGLLGLGHRVGHGACCSASKERVACAGSPPIAPSIVVLKCDAIKLPNTATPSEHRAHTVVSFRSVC
jgi:hypothetical protein